MRVIQLFLSLLILFAIASCDKKCYRELTVEEKSRLGFKANEIIIFKSNLNQFDTLKITGKVKEYVYVKEEKCKREQHEFDISGEFKQHFYSPINFISFLTRIHEPPSKSKDFVYPEIVTNLGYFEITKNTSLTSININGKQLFNVYELSNGSHDTNFDVDKIYFSFEYGLLKIVLHDGSYWERINY